MKNELSKIKTKDLLKELKGRGIDLYSLYEENEKTFKKLLKDKDKDFVKYFKKAIPNFQLEVMDNVVTIGTDMVWDNFAENVPELKSPEHYFKLCLKAWKNKK